MLHNFLATLSRFGLAAVGVARVVTASVVCFLEAGGGCPFKKIKNKISIPDRNADVDVRIEPVPF